MNIILLSIAYIVITAFLVIFQVKRKQARNLHFTNNLKLLYSVDDMSPESDMRAAISNYYSAEDWRNRLSDLMQILIVILIAVQLILFISIGLVLFTSENKFESLILTFALLIFAEIAKIAVTEFTVLLTGRVPGEPSRVLKGYNKPDESNEQ